MWRKTAWIAVGILIGYLTQGVVSAQLMQLTDGTIATKVVVYDLSGTPAGGGVQYAEGATDASITGTVVMWEDAADTIRAASSTYPLPVTVISGGGGGTQYTEADTDASITGTAVLVESASNTLRTWLAVLPADNSAIPAFAPWVFSINGCYDGATIDLCPTGDGGAGAVSANTSRVVIATDDPVNDMAVDFNLALVVEDVAETAANQLLGIGAVQRDVAASSAGATGDNATFNVDVLGQLWTRQLDPCSGIAKQYFPFDITGAATTEITPSLSGASNYWYVCAVNIVTSAANNVNFVDDNSDNCASVTASLISTGLAAGDGWNFGANGGLTIGNGQGAIMKSVTTNSVLCLVSSASAELHGTIVAVPAP